jgi:hypothetical protein
MRILSLSLIGLLTTLSAQAAVTGQWFGTGTWGFQGSAVDCSMKMQYREDDSKLERVGGYFDCGLVGMHSDPLTWQKTNEGKLQMEGQDVGTISEAGFEATEDYGSDVKVTTKFRHDGRQGTYEERWVNDKGVEIYVIQGTLRLKETVRP